MTALNNRRALRRELSAAQHIPYSAHVAPHIVATAYLNELSTAELNGVAGIAVAAFKRFEFFDDAGVVQETELTTITSWIDVPQCVSITIAFDLRAAFANAGWTFYWIA